VAWSVLDMADQRAVGARQLEDAGGEVAVLDLLAAADVVDRRARPGAGRASTPAQLVLDVNQSRCLATSP
jgi:hypothetical protein